MSAPAACAPAPSGLRWPVLIVAMLAANVSLCAVTVRFALRDRPPSAGVSSASMFAASEDQDRMNASLGWTVGVSVERRGDGRVLVVTADDGSGRPIRSARVHARVGEDPGRVLTLSPGGDDGRFEAELAPTDPPRARVCVVVESLGMRYRHAADVRAGE